MILKHLYLRNFRSYKSAEVTFHPQMNLFFGGNAEGKTSLLEAISLLSTGRSFRTLQLKDLIHEGTSFFYLEAELHKEGFDHCLKLHFDGNSRRLDIDNTLYSSFQPLLGIFPAVFFTPFDAQIIYGSPSIRRRFMNIHIAQSDPLYIQHWSRYWKAMKQRNTLLRIPGQKGIECFEEEMALSADYVVEKREEFFQNITPLLEPYGETLSNQQKTTLRYLPSAKKKTLLSLLEKNRKKEQILGYSLFGPHRDDFSLFIEEKGAKLFASEGQIRSSLAALRFSQWALLKNQGNSAALCIDDFAVHLDPLRKALLESSLKDFSQVFVTTPENSLHYTGSSFSIEKGAIAKV